METPRPLPYKPFLFTDLEGMLAEPPVPAWLIRGYLEADSLAVLYGASGVMKTFVALDMAFSVAAGLPWHGISTHNPGPCFYIAGEGQRGLRKRLKALAVHHAANASDVHFFTSNEPVQLLDRDSTAALVEAVSTLAAQYGTPRLVVIDTLNRCFGAGDENKTADMTDFISALDEIRLRFGCAVLVVHHSGNKKQERSRGSSALRAAIDFEYSLTDKGKIKVLECTKIKDHDEPAQISFQPETVATGWIDPETGEEITSCVLQRVSARVCPVKRLSGALAVAYEALKVACGSEGRAHEKAWREEAYKMKISKSEKQDSMRQAFARAMGGLIGQGDVVADAEPDFYRPSRHSDANNDIGKTSSSGRQDHDIDQTCQAQHDGQTDKTPPL